MFKIKSYFLGYFEPLFIGQLWLNDLSESANSIFLIGGKGLSVAFAHLHAEDIVREAGVVVDMEGLEDDLEVVLEVAGVCLIRN